MGFTLKVTPSVGAASCDVGSLQDALNRAALKFEAACNSCHIMGVVEKQPFVCCKTGLTLGRGHF